MKLPPSSFTSPVDLCTSPTVSQIHSSLFLVIFWIGILCTYTQNVALLKSRSWIGVLLTYLCNTTKCLSKLQGWFWIILSTSAEELKTKRTIWLLRFWMLKPLVDLQICLKVLATISKFKKWGVMNFAAKMNSWDCCSPWRAKSESSLLERDMFHQVSVISSILVNVEWVIGSSQKEKCFPNPTKKKPHKLHEYTWYP